MYPKKIVALCCLIITLLTARAQQGNIWYFGKVAGLKFGYTGPQALTDGVMSSTEGTAVMCDENGNLLFYTDGVTVWNRNHKPMPNGTGLKGNTSSFQSCLIVPKPGDPDIYFVFTTDAMENNGASGYNYSEIDMTLDGGMGDITTIKNIFLNGPSSERIAGVIAANYIDYWVVTNDWNSNVFRAYKVTCAGVDPNPTISTVGIPMNASTFSNIGAMKISPDGQWLVQTNYNGSKTPVPVNEIAQLFRFDNTSGNIYAPTTISLINDGYYLGCEFSPDSRYLYLTNRSTRTLHQYDLSSGVPATILSTKSVVPIVIGSIAQLQLAPDGKIYMANGTDKLHVINSPNNAAPACGLQENAADLKGRTSVLGLPSVVPNLYANKAIDFTYTILDSCMGTVQFNGVDHVLNSTVYWDFGDGTSSTLINPVHTFKNPNKIQYVKIYALINPVCGANVSGQFLVPGGAFLKGGFSYTSDCSTRNVTIKDSSSTNLSSISYKYDFGDGTTSTVKEPVHTYLNTGTYTITQIVSALSGCGSDTVTRTVIFSPIKVNAGPDIDVLAGSTTNLTATGASQFQWAPTTYLSNPNIANPTVTPLDDITYVVRGTDANGCSGTDTMSVKVTKATLVEVPSAFTPNGDGLNDVLRPLVYGIPQLDYFVVYNRWGQKVFETKTLGEGWDGTLNGRQLATDVFIWTLSVHDMLGKQIVKRGTSTLIR
ncbi:MAG: hypothetical protein C5B52_17950 [Bacteroidetes bacterium]|nr:MAG: hypothetical protein C5B52_17950 [Bacteroidota bacterium]